MTGSPAAAAPATVTVHPRDTGAALCNPDMGWVFHYYDNNPQHYGSKLAPSDTLDDFPGLTVIYLRIPWSYIEPEEGKFNWDVVDTPAQRWIAKGKQVAFRFTCSESWMRYATPEWVQKAGAKGHNFTPGKGVTANGPYWEPDFDDPVFLDKLDHFLAAAAKRYDGNPEVAFMDVGSFGVWGEGHTFASTRLPYSAATVERHIDLYLKHFKHTLLAANDDFVSQGRGQASIDYALKKGLTLRDDSILVQGGKRAYFHAGMAQPFWPLRPVILESEHYGPSRDRGNWGDGHLYRQAMEDYHASYVSIHWWPRKFLEANRDLIASMNLRLGYRLQLTEASWPATVPVGGSFTITQHWRNAGVAPCYPGGFPAFTLKDAKGGIAGVFVDNGLDMRSLPVGAPGAAATRETSHEFQVPFFLQGDRYEVYVSVGTRTGTPKIALPLPDDDGQHRYRLGVMRIIGDYGVSVGEPRRQNARWLLPLTWTIHRDLPTGAKPFCHFENAGKIAFQGFPEPLPPGWGKPGTTALPCSFTVPDKARGHSYTVKVGIFNPARMGKPDERMIPDKGESDRRVVAGTLLVGEDGRIQWTASEHP